MGFPILAKAVAAFLKAAIVVAPVGKEVPIRLKSGMRPKEVWVANARVIDSVAELSVFRVIGKAPGFSPVVLTDDKRSQFFLVVVPKPK